MQMNIGALLFQERYRFVLAAKDANAEILSNPGTIIQWHGGCNRGVEKPLTPVVR